jgi:2-C-methyl-D-erythritol 4-phosphate cytidylyltransferase
MPKPIILSGPNIDILQVTTPDDLLLAERILNMNAATVP